MFEYAVVGMWCYAGIVTGYNSFIVSSYTADIYYDTFAASLLSIYQVRHPGLNPVVAVQIDCV